MTKITKEDSAGLLGSFAFHAILFLFCILYTLSVENKKPEFVELSFTQFTPEKPLLVMENQSLTSIPEHSMARIESNISKSPKSSPALPKSETIVKSAPRINPPRYGLSMENSEIKLPESKMDISDSKATTEKPSYSGSEKGNPSSSFGEKESKVGSITGDKNIKDATSIRQTGRDNIIEPTSPSNVGKAVTNYTIQWKDGGSRTKISGSLPKLESLSKQVQIKLKIIVKPDGSITQITPLQKGDYKLENTAIQAIKNWKFEPLRSDLSQVDQSGIVTFLFKLE